MPRIDWKKLANSVKLFMLHDRFGASLRNVAKEIGMNKSALCRLRQGKPVSAANYAQMVMWLGCSSDKYLKGKFRP